MEEKNSLKEVIKRNHEKSNQEYREKLAFLLIMAFTILNWIRKLS